MTSMMTHLISAAALAPALLCAYPDRATADEASDLANSLEPQRAFVVRNRVDYTGGLTDTAGLGFVIETGEGEAYVTAFSVLARNESTARPINAGDIPRVVETWALLAPDTGDLAGEAGEALPQARAQSNNATGLLVMTVATKDIERAPTSLALAETLPQAGERITSIACVFPKTDARETCTPRLITLDYIIALPGAGLQLQWVGGEHTYQDAAGAPADIALTGAPLLNERGEAFGMLSHIVPGGSDTPLAIGASLVGAIDGVGAAGLSRLDVPRPPGSLAPPFERP